MIPEAIHLSIFAAGFCLAILPFLNRDNQGSRLFANLVVIAITIYYMKWRLFDTVLPVEMPTIGGSWIWFCFIVEVMVLIETFTFYFITYRHTDRITEADRFEEVLRSMNPAELPTVDIFLPTYNEGLDVLERSILGCKHIEWPAEKLKVWVLDDSERDWLKSYCTEKGVGYISRPRNEHAKAGNINHAFEYTKGDFIAIFDADFVPHRNFLYRAVGFFIDPKVAILQTPQHFFNRDYVQSNLHLQDTAPDDQRMFFDVMMPSRDGHNAAFWCGSCSVSRRSAMKKTGGIPTESITEDLLTSLTLIRHGYITRYLNEKLSHGLAPETMDALLTQRKRWCRGTIQAMYSEDGPFGEGLTFSQRLLFFPVHWLIGPITRLMVLVVPIVFLWTGLPAISIHHYEEVVWHQLPVLIANFGVVMWLAPRHYLPFLNTAINTINAIQVLPTAIHSLFWPHEKDFGVTPKGKMNKASRYHGLTLFTSLVLFLLTAIGLIINAFPDTRIVHDDGFWPVAAFWAAVNLITIAIMILMSFEHPRARKDERFKTNRDLKVTIDEVHADAVMKDISMGGARFSLKDPRHEVHEGQTLHMHIPDVGAVESQVSKIFEKNVHVIDPESKKVVHGKRRFISVTFGELEGDVHDRLIQHVYTGEYDNKNDPAKQKHIVKGVFKRMFGSHEKVYESRDA